MKVKRNGSSIENASIRRIENELLKEILVRGGWANLYFQKIQDSGIKQVPLERGRVSLQELSSHVFQF